MTSDSWLLVALERSESTIGWCSADSGRLAAAGLPPGGRWAYAWRPLSSRLAADAVWSAPVWGSSVVALPALILAALGNPHIP
jgi:hypothetical protein